MLAKMGDYDAAISQIGIVFLKLTRQGVGSLACVYNPECKDNGLIPNSFICTVMTEEEFTSEVLLTNDETEMTVKASFVKYIPNSLEDAFKFAKLCNVAAKYALLRTNPYAEFSACCSTIALSLFESMLVVEIRENIWMDGGVASFSVKDIKQLLFDSYMLVTRARILQNKFNAAAAMVRKAVFLDPGNKSARVLVKIIKQRQMKQQRNDKQLARNVAAWVQKAMKSEEIQPSDFDRL